MGSQTLKAAASVVVVAATIFGLARLGTPSRPETIQELPRVTPPEQESPEVEIDAPARTATAAGDPAPAAADPQAQAQGEATRTEQADYVARSTADWKRRFDRVRGIDDECAYIFDSPVGDGYSGFMDQNSRNCTDGVVAMYRATGDTRYLDLVVDQTLQLIDWAVPTSSIGSYDDDFLGWPAYPSRPTVEQPLEEAIGWRTVALTLREMQRRGHHTGAYRDSYLAIRNFLEVNIFDKWYSRGLDNFLRSRTHLNSHMGLLCVALLEISPNATRRARCTSLLDDIIDGSHSIRRQFVPHPTVPGAIVWTNVIGKTPTQTGYTADTGHEGSTLLFIAEAYDAGLGFTDAEIRGIVTLLDRVVLADPSRPVPVWIGGETRSCPYDDSVCDARFGEGLVAFGRYDAALQRKIDRYADHHQPVHAIYASGLYGHAAYNAARLAGTVPS